MQFLFNLPTIFLLEMILVLQSTVPNLTWNSATLYVLSLETMIQAILNLSSSPSFAMVYSRHHHCFSSFFLNSGFLSEWTLRTSALRFCFSFIYRYREFEGTFRVKANGIVLVFFISADNLAKHILAH